MEALLDWLQTGQYRFERHLLRRKSTGEVIDPDFLEFAYPTRWHYDVLRGLDYFRSTASGRIPGWPRRSTWFARKQQPDGTWLLENTHEGAVHFTMDAGDGLPSRWNTLRALRVLRWFDSGRTGVANAASAR